MDCSFSAVTKSWSAVNFGLLWLIFSPPISAQELADTKAEEVRNSVAESAEESDDLETTMTEILAGHSHQGDAFNEGPRQSAYLMGGTGIVNFPVTTKSALAQKFINQGVGQLHGFWYLEAERSFRQAISLDQDCAMAYWGAAWAAGENNQRAQGFIAKAVELKTNASEHDQMYIDALSKYLSDKPAEKSKRAAQYLKDLESIVLKFPDDLEAKAFVAHRVWQNGREGIPLSSYLSVDALLQQVFDQQPLHPAHHYAIHLWDNRQPEQALASAASGGVAAPAIAHMWHMPGHIYSRLHRYEDAIYQQEASARVDHAQMIRDAVMPDEIHNFAHNNEWLIRNLSFVGRAQDAVALAKNMIELPQHPKFNTLKKVNGSASYGRRRLLQLLREFELHEQAIKLAQSNYLELDEGAAEQVKVWRLLGCAAAILQQSAEQESAVAKLKSLKETQRTLQDDLAKKIATLRIATDTADDAPPRARESELEPEEAKKQLTEQEKRMAEVKPVLDQIDKALMAVKGYELVAKQEFKTAHQQLEKATGEDVSWLGELQFLAGDTEPGLKTVKKQVQRRPQEIIPLARLAFLQHQNGDVADCQKTFQQLRETSGVMDLDLPILARLKPIAAELKLNDDWRLPHEPAGDLGYRPPLDSLGPFRWSAPQAPIWSLVDADKKTQGSNEFAGQPYILIFYLGHGCLHCAEQLNAFAPHVSEFENAGFKMLAISSDDRDGLQESINNFTGDLPYRFASDESLKVFRQFRAYDDFESQPLHGTFLIDGEGKIRWQDISYEPFMDHEFLLKEAQRLMGCGGL